MLIFVVFPDFNGMLSLKAPKEDLHPGHGTYMLSQTVISTASVPWLHLFGDFSVNVEAAHLVLAALLSVTEK